MTYERSLEAGMTDYTGVPLSDILSHIDDWISATTEVLSFLRSAQAQLPIHSGRLKHAGDVATFITAHIGLFSRYLGDFERLRRELPHGVRQAHLDLVQQVSDSASREDRAAVRFKVEVLSVNYSDEATSTYLEPIYSEVRGLLLDYFDLSNLVPRLRVFIDTAPPSEALTDLHLKPNVFGVGLNLNRVFGRAANWWRRKRNTPSA